ncbi:polysaccharide pyruvyl transferase family protein [Paraburkholderia lycopersici]|uniref:Polysaccharide pyruvyl transferase family protein WcaK n=1 Tax=Paraburkholderia lycopersici TaxID=416944 RepID=A0A1G6XWA4_9BURK|nr:polysaccharide pyruvyl transferase family protein [Paraburkholderia lycopersici]SDD82400.1 Polysaccharide pyruvyl transferase family protein WcaK [Paraburkholderia lycopersici]
MTDVEKKSAVAMTLGASAQPGRREESIGKRRKRGIFKIAFFGFYGRNNFGDDLFGFILQAICTSREDLVAQVVGASSKRELGRAFRLPFVQRFWRARGAGGALARCLTYVAAIACADAVVFGGGTLFGANASIGFARFTTRIGTWLRRPLGALGVSVGPFSSDERQRAFAGVIEQLSCIAVRDESSVKAVSALVGRRPANLGDLAFCLPALYTPVWGRARMRTLVVSIHLDDYTDTVLEILDEVDRSRLADEVMFLSLDEESVAATGDIARLFEPKHVRVCRYRYAGSIAEVVDRLANASCVVTSKLHGAITSYVYDVPALLFCYQRKCVEFLNDCALPGPRDPLPAAADCVATVKKMLAAKCESRQFARAADHMEAFGRFLEEMKNDRPNAGERAGPA